MWPQTAVITWVQFNSNTRVRTDVHFTEMHTLGHSDSKASSESHVLYKMYRNCSKQKYRGHFTYAIQIHYINHIHPSRWLHFLRSRSAAALLLGLWVRIPSGGVGVGGMCICVLWMFCVVRWRSVWRADQSSRGVLPSVVCLGVIRRNNNPLHLQWVDRRDRTKRKLLLTAGDDVMNNR